jgi:hypothetical protein
MKLEDVIVLLKNYYYEYECEMNSSPRLALKNLIIDIEDSIKND